MTLQVRWPLVVDLQNQPGLDLEAVPRQKTGLTLAAVLVAVLVEVAQREAEALGLGLEHHTVFVLVADGPGTDSGQHFSAVACLRVPCSVGCLVLEHICSKGLRTMSTAEAGMGRRLVVSGLLPVAVEEWIQPTAESSVERRHSQLTRQDAVFPEAGPPGVT